MKEFKLKNFKKDYPSFDLTHKELNQKEIDDILSFVKISGVSDIVEIDNIFEYFIKNHENKISIDGINEKDGLSQLFKSVSVEKTGNAFVIWNKKEVDVFEIDTLLEYWDYIWYGEVDEAIFIYLPTNKILFMVTDHGNVFFNRAK